MSSNQRDTDGFALEPSPVPASTAASTGLEVLLDWLGRQEDKTRGRCKHYTLTLHKEAEPEYHKDFFDGRLGAFEEVADFVQDLLD